MLLLQQHFQLDDELVHHAQDVIEAQALELDDGIEAVAELRREAPADHFHRIGRVVLLREADRPARGLCGTRVGRHHQDDVLEVRLAAVGIRQHTAVHDLQQDVEDVGMRLLDLVQQQHTMRRLDDLFRQQAALVETDIARRCADQSADRMRLHVLAHVEADQFDAQLQRELLGHLGLAHAGGAGEQEVADRLVRIAQAATRELDRRGKRFDGGILTEDDHLQVALQVLQHVLVGRGHLFGGDARHLGHDGFDFLDVDQLLARFQRQQPLAGAGFVDDVDGLVGQQAIADVLDRQVDRGLQRVVGVGHAVVRLVLGLQSLQDLVSLADRGFHDVDLLEAPCERTVLLEDPAVFLERGRADATQFARCQRRLDQVGRIHRAAAGGAGPDDGVDLVDEQDGARDLLDRRQYALQALLEVAAVLGARHQRAEIQRIDDRIQQHVGHFALDDALGQTLRQRGLADACFTDIERIVLAAAAQDLDGALDLVPATDQRVDLALPCEVVEVAGELGKGVALAFAVRSLCLALAFRVTCGVVFLALLGDAMRQIVDDVQPGHILLVEEVHRMRILLAKDRHQHVGASDLLLARGLHVVDGALQHALEAQRRLGVAAIVFRQAGDRGFDRLFQVRTQAARVRAGRLQDGLRRGIFQEREQQVLDGHEFVPSFTGALVALADGLLEVFAEHGCLRGRCRQYAAWRAVFHHPTGFQCSGIVTLYCAAAPPHRSCRSGCPCRVPQDFSIVHSKGCWFIRENSLTWATLDSATSRV